MMCLIQAKPSSLTWQLAFSRLKSLKHVVLDTAFETEMNQLAQCVSSFTCDMVLACWEYDSQFQMSIWLSQCQWHVNTCFIYYLSCWHMVQLGRSFARFTVSQCPTVSANSPARTLKLSGTYLKFSPLNSSFTCPPLGAPCHRRSRRSSRKLWIPALLRSWVQAESTPLWLSLSLTELNWNNLSRRRRCHFFVQVMPKQEMFRRSPWTWTSW